MKHPIARYLMCAYAYYVEDAPLISDYEFDSLSKYLLSRYDELEHPHKHLITKNDLIAGTYLGEYPEMVKGAVSNYRQHMGRLRTPPMNWEVEEKVSTLSDFFV